MSSGYSSYSARSNQYAGYPGYGGYYNSGYTISDHRGGYQMTGYPQSGGYPGGYPNSGGYYLNGYPTTMTAGRSGKKASKQHQQNSKQLKQQKPAYNYGPDFDDDLDEEERGEWGSKAEFILSCIGYSVGIGNVWRFPYLAYQHGGSAFLLPYIILLVLVGKPMYYLETAMGQFTRSSPVKLWRCAPIMTGVGYGMCVLSLIVAIYYNVIMAYSVIYMGASFRGITENLPWTNCSEWWGADENCVSTFNTEDKSFLKLKRCRPELFITENCTDKQTSAAQFWEKYVLNITDGLSENFGDIGGFKYDLPLALLFSWLIVFLCLMKGVKSSGKVVYFTATFPYVILIALLIRGCTLPGAIDGIKFLFVPRMEELLDIKPWRAAAEQMFFSLGISWGGLMMFGSYNKFKNRIDIDAGVVSSLDFITSLIASCVIFSVLGFLAQELGVGIKEVAEGGQGLAFVVYPEALARLPGAWVWAVLFFFMLFLLGLDSEFALLETVLTVIYDAVPALRRHKVKMTALACSVCFLLGLPCVSASGQYVLDLMDTYGAGFAVLWTGFWEVVGLAWIYGVWNVSKDIELMVGKPSIFWRITWAFTAPVTLGALFIIGAAQWTEHKYSEVVPFPEWATGIGWGLLVLSAIQVPIWAIIMVVYYAINGELKQVIKPTRQWGPGDKEVRRAILDEQQGISRMPRYAYDNEAMGYAGYQM